MCHYGWVFQAINLGKLHFQEVLCSLLLQGPRLVSCGQRRSLRSTSTAGSGGFSLMRTVLSLSFFGDGGVTSGTLSPLTSVTGRTLTLFDSLNYNELPKP